VRILVCEPHAEVRALLAHVVERLGHEPVFPSEQHGDVLPKQDVDVLVLEPADPGALATAARLRGRHGALPIVCASIHPDSSAAESLRPVAYLVKPFGLAELETALRSAVESVTSSARLAS
jgi:CheY-like chemotaxis protein